MRNDNLVRPRVAFFVNEHCHYVEFKKILESPSVKDQIEAHILFDRHVDDPFKLFRNQISDARRSGYRFSVVHTYMLRNSGHWTIQLLSRFVRVSNSSRFDRLPLISQLRRVPRAFLRLASEIAFFRKRIQLLERWVSKRKIETIVLGEENVLLDTFIYSRTARDRRMVIYPYTIPNPDEMVRGALLVGTWNTLKAKTLFYFGGRWTRKFGNDVYLLLNPFKLAAMYLLGFRPNNPWVLNAGYAEKICVESDRMAGLYSKLSIPEPRIEVTGSFNDDILAAGFAEKESRYDSILKKYGLQKKPIVLIALPPNQFPIKNAEFENYSQLLSALAGTLAPFKENYNLIAVRHPRLIQSLSIIEEAGIVVADEPTIDLIPISELYIASVSATIRWAISAGLPVINYDMYRYRYDDYKDVVGVITVEDIRGFDGALKLLLNDRGRFLEFQNAQAAVAPTWGLIDGKSGQRFLNVISGNV